MRTLVAVMLTMILSGCVGATPDGASRLVERLEKPIDALSEAAVTNDLALIRAKVRDVVATYDAGVGPQ